MHLFVEVLAELSVVAAHFVGDVLGY